MRVYDSSSFLSVSMRGAAIAVLGLCFADAPASADYADPFTTEVNRMSDDQFEIQARGNSRLPLELLQKAAFVKAAWVTLDAASNAFRINKSLRRTITSRRSRSIKSFAVSIEIKIHKPGQITDREGRWYDARKIVLDVGEPLKLELKKFVEQNK